MRSVPSSILIVEDNEVNQQIVVEVLNALHLHTDTALNGKDAVRKVQERQYDLVLMDIQMPEMDGYDATREIRKSQDSAALPIVAMTAYALDQDKVRAFDAGMNNHLAKPINESELVEVLSKYLILENIDETLPQESPDSAPSFLDKLTFLDTESVLGTLRNNEETYHRILVTTYENHRHDMNRPKSSPIH